MTAPITMPATVRPDRSPEVQGPPVPPAALLAVAGVLLPVALTYALVMGDPLVMGAVVAAMLAALVILARPFWGLALFIGLVFVRPEDTFTALQGKQLSLLVATVTLFAAWIQLHLNRQPLVKHPMLLMMAGFWGACVLSTVSGGNLVAAAMDVGKLFLLVWMVLNLVRTPERYRRYETLLLLLIGYLAVVVIYRAFTGQVLETGEGDRAAATGVLGDPNDSAAVIAAGLALALNAGLDRSRHLWPLFWPLAGLMAWAIFLTQSRGGMLALVVAVGGTIMLHSRRRGRGLALAAAAGFLLISTIGGRISNFDSQEASANSRWWFWDAGIAMLQSNPLTGVGYGQYGVHNDGRAAHGSLPLAFGETGLLGCYFWLGTLYIAFRRANNVSGAAEAVRAVPRIQAPALALAAYLTAVFFLSHTYMPVLFVLASLPLVQWLVNVSSTRSSRLVFADGLRIGALTLVAPVIVKMLVWRLG